MSSNVRLAVIVGVFVVLGIVIIKVFGPMTAPVPDEDMSVAAAKPLPEKKVEARDEDDSSPKAAKRERPRRAERGLSGDTKAAVKLAKSAETGDGIIRGTVTGHGGTAPGAEVFLERLDWKVDERPPLDTFRKTATTDGDGAFVFEGLPITAKSPEYALHAYTKSQMAFDSVSLSNNRPERTVDLELKGGALIEGRVVDRQGQPVANAVVQAYAVERQKREILPQSWVVATKSVSAADGTFRVIHPWPGLRLRVSAMAEGYAPGMSEAVPAMSTGVEIVLSKGGTVSGTVVDAATQEPMPRMKVLLTSTRPLARCAATSDKSGAFQVKEVPAGELTATVDDDRYLVADKPAPVKVAEDQDVTGVVIGVTLGATIAGRVYDADTDEGVAGVEVNAYRSGIEQQGPRKAKTDATGQYLLEGIPQGENQVVVQDTPGYPSDNYGERSKKVRIAAAQNLEGIDFALKKGLSLSGTVVTQDGAPVANASIEARSRNGGDYHSASSKADGTFEILGFQPASDIQVQARKDGFACRPVGPFAITDQGVSDVTITMTPEGTIEGVIVDARSKPVAKGELYARPEGSFSFGRSVTANAQGHFKIKGLYAATYTVQGNPPNTHYWRGDNGTEVEVHEGQAVTGITVVIKDEEGLTISGRVTDANGNPVRGADLRAQTNNGGSYGYAEAGADGRYKMGGLKEGLYRVSSERYGFSKSEIDNVEAGSENVNLVLERAGAIEGNVVDASGNPVKDFQVYAYQGQRAFESWVVSNMTSTHTEDGAFRVGNINDNDATVFVQAAGFAPKAQYVTGVPAGGVLSGVVVQLESGCVVEGTVRDVRGNPISAARIFVGALPDYWRRQNSQPAAFSNADGAFRLDSVSAETAMISADHPSYSPASTSVSVAPGRVAHADIVMNQGGTIEGVVTLDRRPVAASVNVHISGQGSSDQRQADTGANGAYRIGGLAGSECTVSVWVRGGPSVDRNLSRTAIVAEGKTTEVNFNFVSGDADIEGRLTVGNEPPRGNAHISAQVPTAQGTESYRAEPDANGYFSFEGLPAGSVELQASARPDGQQQLSRRVMVETVRGRTTSVNIDLLAGPIVRGRVTNADVVLEGDVAAFSGQVAIPSQITEASMNALMQNSPQAGHGSLNTDGTFLITGLAPGTYTLLLMTIPKDLADSMQSSQTRPDEATMLAQMRTATAVVTVPAEGSVDVELALK